MKETTRAAYVRAYTRPYQKTGMGKFKRNGNTYGMVRSVHRPFNYWSILVRCPFFLKRVPFVRIERENFFFYAYRTCTCTCMKKHTHIQGTYITSSGADIRTYMYAYSIYTYIHVYSIYTYIQYMYSRHQKKVPISRPYNGTGNSVLFPFRSRLISVRLPFSNRSRFVPRDKKNSGFKYAQSLIAVISAGRLATVQ